MPRSLASSRSLVGSARSVNKPINALAKTFGNSLRVAGTGTDGFVTVTEFANLQDVFATGGAISMWVKSMGLGAASAGNFIIKGAVTTGGWVINLASSFVPRFAIGFDGGSSGNWRLTGSFLLNEWCYMFIWYNASNTSNIPTVYSCRRGFQLVKQTPTVVSSPTGTVRTDAGTNMGIGNNLSNNRGSDCFMTDIRIYKGSEPTQAQVGELYRSGVDPSGLTLVDRWAKGTTSFESDSGSNNGVITSPASMTSYLPYTIRTLVS